MTFQLETLSPSPCEMHPEEFQALLCVTVARASSAWAPKKMDLCRLFQKKPEWTIQNCNRLKGSYLAEWTKGYFFPDNPSAYELAAKILINHRPVGFPLKGQSAFVHPDGNIALCDDGDGYIWCPNIQSQSEGDRGQWTRIFSTSRIIWRYTPQNQYANGTPSVAGDIVKLKNGVSWLNPLATRPKTGEVLQVKKGSALVRWHGSAREHYLLASLFPCEELLKEGDADTTGLTEAQMWAYTGIQSGDYSFEKRGRKLNQLVVKGKTITLSILNVLLKKNLLPEDIVQTITQKTNT